MGKGLGGWGAKGQVDGIEETGEGSSVDRRAGGGAGGGREVVWVLLCARVVEGAEQVVGRCPRVWVGGGKGGIVDNVAPCCCIGTTP